MQRPLERPPQRHLHLAVASRRPAATIAIRGTLSHSGARRIARAVAALPGHVESAHLDLARVRLVDVAALEWLVEAVRSWAIDRCALVLITPPEFRLAP